MTVTFDEGKPSLEDLEHYGKKGMKWGVRKKGLASQAIAAKTARLKSLDPKKANLAEKMHVSGLQAIRAGGVNKAALKNRKKIIDRQTRVVEGKAKALEVLREVGSVSLLDIATRNQKPPARKK